MEMLNIESSILLHLLTELYQSGKFPTLLFDLNKPICYMFLLNLGLFKHRIFFQINPMEGLLAFNVDFPQISMQIYAISME